MPRRSVRSMHIRERSCSADPRVAWMRASRNCNDQSSAGGSASAMPGATRKRDRTWDVGCPARCPHVPVPLPHPRDTEAFPRRSPFDGGFGPEGCRIKDAAGGKDMGTATREIEGNSGRSSTGMDCRWGALRRMEGRSRSLGRRRCAWMGTDEEGIPEGSWPTRLRDDGPRSVPRTDARVPSCGLTAESSLVPARSRSPTLPARPGGCPSSRRHSSGSRTSSYRAIRKPPASRSALLERHRPDASTTRTDRLVDTRTRS
jgi:hypothetical protein